MSLRRLVYAFLLTTLAAGTAVSHELGVRSFGLRGGVNANPDQFNAGFHADAGRFADRLRFQPSAEIGLGNGVRLVSANADVHYLFAPRRFRPYAGGGLGVNFVDVTSGIGSARGLQVEPILNAVGGVEWGTGLRYLLEARIGFGDTPELKVVAGLNF